MNEREVSGCDFCKIARGTAPAEVVCHGDRWVAFFPRNPATPGHTLVIPRTHYSDFWEISDTEVASDLAVAAVNVGRAIGAALHPDGMNLVTSAGRTAEQSVFHVHLHIVPRWEGDGFGKIWPTGHRFDKDDLDNVADLIREHC